MMQPKFIPLAVILGFLFGAALGYETSVLAVKREQKATAAAVQQAHAKSVAEQHRKMFGNTQKGLDNIGKIP